MFKRPWPTSEKGRLYALIGKRNAQLAAIFKRVKDPVNILQFYLALSPVVQKFFGTDSNLVEVLNVLTWLFDEDYMWLSDIRAKVGCSQRMVGSLVRYMVKRNLISVGTAGTYRMLHISPDGRLFLRHFQVECATAIMGVIRTGRKGRPKKKYTTSITTKKPRTKRG